LMLFAAPLGLEKRKFALRPLWDRVAGREAQLALR
jgi:hypothetical protein